MCRSGAFAASFKAACSLLLAEPVHSYNKRNGQKVTLQLQISLISHFMVLVLADPIIHYYNLKPKAKSSFTVRHLIGLRSPSDRIAFAV